MTGTASGPPIARAILLNTFTSERAPIMANPLSLIGSAALGAGAMYFFDPVQGTRRRALMRDQLTHASCRCGKAAEVVRRDASNRLYGYMAQVRSAMNREQPSDEVLVERVRSKVGRWVSHPGSIKVTATDGHVVLSGMVLADEADGLVSSVRSVPGVRSLETELDVRREPGNVSGLQGGKTRTGETMELWQQNWSPTMQAAVGAAALGLTVACLTGCSRTR